MNALRSSPFLSPACALQVVILLLLRGEGLGASVLGGRPQRGAQRRNAPRRSMPIACSCHSPRNERLVPCRWRFASSAFERSGRVYGMHNARSNDFADRRAECCRRSIFAPQQPVQPQYRQRR
jgi:hypothetical protein